MASFLDLLSNAGQTIGPALTPAIPGMQQQSQGIEARIETGITQAQVKAGEVGEQVKEYAYAQLTMQAISTLAIAGIFLIQLAQSNRDSGKSEFKESKSEFDSSEDEGD